MFSNKRQKLANTIIKNPFFNFHIILLFYTIFIELYTLPNFSLNIYDLSTIRP
ncbi:hypothetical protein PSKAS_06330 [Peribacillus sp. N1]